MRKLFIAILAVLGLAACQTESSELDIEIGDAVVRNVVVSLDQETRATSDKGFDLTTLATSDYELRYILEVYLDGNSSSQTTVYSTSATTQIPVMLVPGRNYRIVVWADLVEKVADRDLTQNYDRYYTTTNGLTAIEIKDLDGWKAMDETRDAYAGYQDVIGYGAESDITVKLSRPFAKLRAVATDINECKASGKTPTTVEVSYDSVPTKYNVYDSTATEFEAKSHTITLDHAVYEDVSGEKTLLADYIFANVSGQELDFSIEIKDQSDATIKNHQLLDVLVEKNRLTTIKGTLLGGN